MSIPARLLAVEGNDRQETVVYWTRLGEYLPLNGNEQRKNKLQTAFKGIIPDGVLCRFSAAAAEADGREIRSLAVALLEAMPPEKRQLLIGSARAAAMRNGPVQAAPPA